MRHNLIVEGLAFRLRPIGDADIPLVLELRGNRELNHFLHPISEDPADQAAWFARYYEVLGDYYFVVERLESGIAEGLVSVYDISPQADSGEWGRWILRPGSLAAIESAWLIYRCAFEELGLKRVFCRTVATNSKVVSFHDSCGIVERRVLKGHFDLNDQRVDAIEHTVDTESWIKISQNLETLAHLTARRLFRG